MFAVSVCAWVVISYLYLCVRVCVYSVSECTEFNLLMLSFLWDAWNGSENVYILVCVELPFEFSPQIGYVLRCDDIETLYALLALCDANSTGHF